jgi:selenocysteine lyase/cysteine desulfurase
LPDDAHYLNCAYMGPLPVRAQRAGSAGIARKAVPSDITTADFFRDSDRVRALFARLVGAADPSRVAIMPAVSYGIATAARNLACAAGQRIVIAAEQFPSNVHAWRRLAAERAAALVAVGVPDGGDRAARWNEAILDAIDERTAIVALPHVHWTDGTRFDLERIGARARAAGAALVIDGTQSIGALPFDVDTIQPDLVVCAAYKWLLGPYGITFGWFGPRFDDGQPLEETWIGRAHSEDFRRLIDYQDEYQPGAVRYDMGERSNFVLLPMAAEAMGLVSEWQPARVQDYCAALCAGVIEEAVALGYGIEDDGWRGAHLFGLRTPPGFDLQDLQDALAARRVFASLRGSALRVAPNAYNDERDVAALVAALRATFQGRAARPAETTSRASP